MGWIEGKVALITGAAVGLGNAFAEALAAEGAAVSVCDVRPEVGAVAASLMERHGVPVSVYVADVGQPPDVWRVVEETVASLGGIDILVNNAGMCVPTDVTAGMEASVADFDRTFDVNTRATFLFGRAVMPVMLGRGGGHIVNVVTDHVYAEPGRPAPGGPAMDCYDASKWAINGFTLAWARALDGLVRVNGLCMGATDSEMLRTWVGGNPSPELVASWKRPAEVAAFLVELLEEGPDGRSGWNLPIWVNDPIVMPELTDDWAVRVGTMTAAAP
jgi:NAD(P)-dependent dehydrogenase (short-subunit alcohol dehydrogenase family)